MKPGVATGFLSGAKGRLLPASVPFRFFLAAAGFHVVAWVTLFLGADDLPDYTGGPGPVLAAIHLTTLGVLAMTAMGASFQLLPVVTHRALVRTWPARLAFWLFAPGVAVLSWGMGSGAIAAMQAGGVLAGSGLALFAALTALNLARAGAIAVVAGHGWAALAALTGLVGLGLTLIWDFAGGFLADHAGLAALHMVLGVFGFMGLLVGGFSMVLIPMFVLSRSLPPGPGWAALGLSLLGLAAFIAATLGAGAAGYASGFWWGALAAAAGATGVHLWLMRRAERQSMRRRLGLSFALIRAGRLFLPAALILAVLMRSGIAVPNWQVLMGFLLVGGWLLTFLMGVLQRILPFLASMHASGMSGLPMLLSELTAEGPLRVHSFAHFGAIAIVAAGIVLGDAMLIRLGAGVGFFGALAFAVFAANVAWKLSAAQKARRAS